MLCATEFGQSSFEFIFDAQIDWDICLVKWSHFKIKELHLAQLLSSSSLDSCFYALNYFINSFANYSNNQILRYMDHLTPLKSLSSISLFVIFLYYSLLLNWCLKKFVYLFLVRVMLSWIDHGLLSSGWRKQTLRKSKFLYSCFLGCYALQ